LAGNSPDLQILNFFRMRTQFLLIVMKKIEKYTKLLLLFVRNGFIMNADYD